MLIDGGLRRSTNVLKAIALGACMVFAGRPSMYAAAVDKRAGVQHALANLGIEIARNFALLGCKAPGELMPQNLRVIGAMSVGAKQSKSTNSPLMPAD